MLLWNAKLFHHGCPVHSVHSPEHQFICLIDEVKELVMMLPKFLFKLTKSFRHVLCKVKGRGFSCFAF